MARRYHESYGDWISTLSFFGVAIFACLEGLSRWENHELIRATFLFIAAILLFLGSLRFSIARFFDEIKRRKND